MSAEPGWAPEGIDSTKANIARVYDYWLGGDNNFQADRDLARASIALNPNSRAIARANRAFLGRAVRYLTGQGIRQFLDIGSGIPTNQNVHQVAQEAVPGSRVVYVDNDEIAAAHSRFILKDNPHAAVLQADLREPGTILSDPATQMLLDFGQPVAVILSAVLHFIPDNDEASAIVATLRSALAPGSYLVISHTCPDGQPEAVDNFQRVYNHRAGTRLRPRSQDEIERVCSGFTFLDPGLAWIPQWRPDSPDDVPADPESYWTLVGVGRYDENP